MPLADGTYNYTARAVDPAGNVSDPSPVLSVTVDTAAPTASSAPDLDAASDTGISNTDHITNDNTPTINLSGFDAYYRLYRDGKKISGDYTTATTYTEPAALADGVHSYMLYAVDAAGNVGPPSSSLAVTIDTQGPRVTSLTPDSGILPQDIPQLVVRFSEPIDTAGVGVADLVLRGSGVGTLTVDSVSPVDSQTMQFNFAGAATDGSVYLNLAPAATTDLAGNPSSLCSVQRTVEGQISLVPGRNVQFYDWDGSLITVTLVGPGSGYLTLNPQGTAGAPIGDIVLTETTPTTSLAVRATGGTVPGTTFQRLLIDNATAKSAALDVLRAGGINLAPGGLIQADGDIHYVALGNIGAGATFTLTGSSVDHFEAGNIGAQASINVPGQIQTFEASSVGSNATISAGEGISTFTVNGTVSSGTLVTAGAEGIAILRLYGNADMTVITPGDVGIVSIVGTQRSPSIASLRMDVKELGLLRGIFAYANQTAVRASDSIGEVRIREMRNSVISAGSIGKITVLRTLADSVILAGYDIGPDLTFGTGDGGSFTTASGTIGVIIVYGDMKRTSIAAGVDPGPDGKFGTADDGVIQSTSLQGAISALSVGGLLVGSSNPYDQFGIVAHSTIDDVLVGGVALDVPWLFGNVSIVENII